MSMCRVLSCVGGRGCLLSAFSWQNSISLCPASFLTPRLNLPVTPGVSLLLIFAFQSSIMKRTTFWGVSSRRSCRIHRSVQLLLLQHYWSGHRLGLPWYWMVCLGKIWKTQQWPQDWKRSVFIPIRKKGNAKECLNYCTIALISHVSKVMLKIFQASLQQYMNRELPDI